MKAKRNHIDIALLTAVLVLMVLSLGVVYSASSTWAMMKYGEAAKLFQIHIVKVLLGFLAIFVFMHIDYHVYQKLSKPIIIAAVILLIGTLALGGEMKGATRWLRWGGIGLQPSEFAKYALIIHISYLIATKKERIKDYIYGLMPLLIWVGMVAVLVLAQPNFSTGAMILLVGTIMIFLGRARLHHMVLTCAPLVAGLGFYMMSAEYRMKRITKFLEGGGYQLYQGIIGFGNGGFFGVGPGESRQRDLFLPESYGDFVFSIVGEEYGLAGTIFVLALFLTIMLRGLRIAKFAKDDFGRLLASGITISITLYALVNAGVTLGIFPTTGLPMPFVSYGGSSMLFSSVAVGILLNISSQTDLYPREVTASVQARPAAVTVG
jgi:cell division protein FtsW